MSPTESQNGRHFASLHVPGAEPRTVEVGKMSAELHAAPTGYGLFDDDFDALIQSADDVQLDAPADEGGG